MCGLTGFVAMRRDLPPTSASLQMFASMFVLSQLRGWDSTGIAGLWRQLPKQGKKGARRGWLSFKECSSPYEMYKALVWTVTSRYLSNEKENKDYREPSIYAAIAHTRAATRGAVSKENAHPFSFGNNRFIGVHNGTIDNARWVYKKLLEEGTPLKNTTEAGKDYADDKVDVTDSEIVLYCIYRWGIEEVYTRIVGAWAFVWYEQDSDTLYFIRNHQRSLHYAFSDKDDSLFWSSEEGMMRYVFDRECASNWKPRMHEEFKPHVLHTLNLGRTVAIPYSTKVFPWTSKKELSLYKPGSVKNTYTGMYHFYGESSSDDYDWGLAQDNGGSEADEKKTETTAVSGSTDPKLPVVLDQKKPKSQVWSKRRQKWMSKAEYDIDVARFGPDVLSPPDSDGHSDIKETDNTVCIYCAHGISDAAGNRKNSLSILGEGVVCGHCASDVKTVEEIMDMYPATGDTVAWVQRFMLLGDLEKKSQGG